MKRKQFLSLLTGAAVLIQTMSGSCLSISTYGAQTEAETTAEAVPSSENPSPESETWPQTIFTEPQTDQVPAPAETQSETSDGPQPVTEKGTEQATEKPAQTETEHQTERPDTEAGSGKPDTEAPESEALSENGTEKSSESGTGTSEETEESSPETNTEETEAEETEPEETEADETETEFLEEILEEETETELSDDVDGGAVYYNDSYWDPSWFIKRDFRFRQVGKVYGLVQGGLTSRIFEKPDAGSRIIGEVPFFGLVYILDETGDWSYVESGNVRGFIPTAELMGNEDSNRMVGLLGEDQFSLALPDIPVSENEAFTYTRTTVQDVLAQKSDAVVLEKGAIHEYPDESSRAVGEVTSGTVVYPLENAPNGWVYVESGDVRGFLRSDQLLMGNPAALIAGSTETPSLATEEVSPEENSSLYYTLKSTERAKSDLGEQIAEYAQTFVGKFPYVWGGTSLKSGADCSGFVQSIYASFGINLPRLAQEQGVSGEPVESLQDAQPGDVVYYGSNPHVGIYIGDGKVCHCTSSSGGTGPRVSNADYMIISSIRRFVIYEDEMPVSETGYRADPTEYSQDQMELMWAIVAQEDNGSYEGALAVISTAMNRTESAKWGYEGGNALSQLTAPGQFCYSNDSYWKPRLHGNVPAYVKQAVYDCLKRGIRNHTHTSFRSHYGSNTPGAVQIGGGNWYFGA
ncbi:NlpC/P60 family protein [Porcincola intestinalis]|uniref:NlpC/P60 family protein n=1 Tax=Porcincola intestinalis TaxID=2606632 RepID=UPI002A80DC61|nr:NlpC/P60 family protein [Porcincola intestinalis]MDY4205134.1 NlpC/P60 family protein [Porcincola intestinalis]